MRRDLAELTPLERERTLWLFESDESGVLWDIPSRHVEPGLVRRPAREGGLVSADGAWVLADQHMNPAEAVRAYRLCGAERAIGYHWGTFRMTDEAYDDPPRELQTALETAGLPPTFFLAPRPGSVMLV